LRRVSLRHFKSKLRNLKLDKYYTTSFTGYSMYPFLKPGDRLVVRRVPAAHVQVGDILVIPGEDNRIVAHRLIKLSPEGVAVTKGDSMFRADTAPVDLESGTADRVVAVIRGRRFICVSSGFRSKIQYGYALLSRRNLTPCAVKLKLKLFLENFQLTDCRLPQYQKRFLLRLLQAKVDPAFEVDWNALVKYFHKEGMAGIAYQCLRDRQLPAQIHSTLAGLYHGNVARNLNFVAALDSLEKALAQAALEVMTLKGASLMAHIYPNIGLRPMEDLDLLVRPADHQCLVRILVELGYRQNKRRTYSFVKGKTVLDIHCSPLNTDRIRNRSHLLPTGLDAIWARSAAWESGYRWIRRPDAADNVLLLAQHLMKHNFSRLIWLEDIYRILSSADNRLWDLLLERADQLQQQKSLAYTLYLLQDYYGLALPVNKGTAGLPPSLSRFEKTLLNFSRHSEPLTFLAPLMAVLSIRGFKKRLHFCFENLFPRKEVLASEFGRSSRRSRILFFPMRFFKSMALLVHHLATIMRVAWGRHHSIL
jgi:hypothetical protein